jgi:hypothetical protein
VNIGALLEMQWHVEAERLEGLQVDRQLVFGRRLDRKLARLLAAQDAIDVSRGLGPLVELIDPVIQQASIRGVVLERIDRRQTKSGSQLDDRVAQRVVDGTRQHNQSTIGLAGHRRDRLLDLGAFARGRCGHLHLEGWRHGFDHAQERRVVHLARVHENRHPIDEGRRLLQDLDPFSGDGGVEIGEAGDVPFRSGIVADEAAADRVGHLGEHDRNGARELLQDREQRRAAGDQDIHGQADQLATVGAHPIGIAGGPANLDLDVAALDPPELVELHAQRRISRLSLRIALGVDQDHAEPAHALLRARH